MNVNMWTLISIWILFLDMGNLKSCLTVEKEEKITLDRGMDSKIFTFDYVAPSETA